MKTIIENMKKIEDAANSLMDDIFYARRVEYLLGKAKAKRLMLLGKAQLEGPLTGKNETVREYELQMLYPVTHRRIVQLQRATLKAQTNLEISRVMWAAVELLERRDYA
jgi:hypothetical protein